MKACVLALNIGSSSIKLAVFDAATQAPLLRANVTRIAKGARATASTRAASAERVAAPMPAPSDTKEAVHWLLQALHERRPEVRVVGVGHRVVHGGVSFERPVRIDAAVLNRLEALAVLAPAHQPIEIAIIEQMQGLLPGLPQVACFDTAFHHTQPKLQRWFALPRALSESGIVRVGFHGLSYEYIAGVLPGIAGARPYRKVIVSHLGSGSSACAMYDRRSVSSTMGFTPLDGMMMGTRCGAIDPGVLLYLQQQRGMAVDALADLLGNQSGLLGVSGVSDNVEVLEASTDPRASEALEMFAERAAAAIAAQCVALAGLEALVFTGGIGEHDATMRTRICSRLQWLGVSLDASANAAHAQHISTADSRIDVYVIPTDEEAVIARATAALLDASERGGDSIG
ncbi:MAG TPA: acetate/propionate family kinase [Rhodanobacteraceae bacterium]|nr:acetate/propionate family kinase [Rhodanobacteraceae bacterium]